MGGLGVRPIRSHTNPMPRAKLLDGLIDACTSEQSVNHGRDGEKHSHNLKPARPELIVRLFSSL
jgi:hypothetical protein